MEKETWQSTLQSKGIIAVSKKKAKFSNIPLSAIKEKTTFFSDGEVPTAIKLEGAEGVKA